MAKIAFELESSVPTVAHLESVLQDEVATVDGKISLVFADVKEDLALWLLTAVTAYHGLIPSPPDPSPPPINRGGVLAEDGLDAELNVVKSSPIKRGKSGLSIKVDHADEKDK